MPYFIKVERNTMNTFYFLCISSLLFFSCENNPNVEIPVPDNTHIQHENKPTGDISTSDNTHVQKNEGSYTYDIAPSISYTDSDEIIYNPDIGFYSVAPIVILNINGIDNKTSIKEYISRIPDFLENSVYKSNATFNLVHLRIDISRFAKRPWKDTSTETTIDKEFTQAALNDIKEILEHLKVNGKTAIIRFAYDDGFNGDLSTPKVCEPKDFNMLLTHIS